MPEELFSMAWAATFRISSFSCAVLSDADFIDSMDDTVKSCPQNALGKLNPYNYFYRGPTAIPAAISGHQPIRMQTASFTLTK